METEARVADEDVRKLERAGDDVEAKRKLASANARGPGGPVRLFAQEGDKGVVSDGGQRALLRAKHRGGHEQQLEVLVSRWASLDAAASMLLDGGRAILHDERTDSIYILMRDLLSIESSPLGTPWAERERSPSSMPEAPRSLVMGTAESALVKIAQDRYNEVATTRGPELERLERRLSEARSEVASAQEMLRHAVMSVFAVRGLRVPSGQVRIERSESGEPTTLVISEDAAPEPRAADDE